MTPRAAPQSTCSRSTWGCSERCLHGHFSYTVLGAGHVVIHTLIDNARSCQMASITSMQWLFYFTQSFNIHHKHTCQTWCTMTRGCCIYTCLSFLPPTRAMQPSILEIGTYPQRIPQVQSQPGNPDMAGNLKTQPVFPQNIPQWKQSGRSWEEQVM